MWRSRGEEEEREPKGASVQSASPVQLVRRRGKVNEGESKIGSDRITQVRTNVGENYNEANN